VLRELQGRAAVADGEQRGAVVLARGGAMLQALLQRALGHVVDEEEGTWAELHAGDAAAAVVVMGEGGQAGGGQRGEGKDAAHGGSGFGQPTR